MGLDFSKLAYLRLRVQQIKEDQVPSLDYFAHDGGYQHYKGKDKVSVSSDSYLYPVASRYRIVEGGWCPDQGPA